MPDKMPDKHLNRLLKKFRITKSELDAIMRAEQYLDYCAEVANMLLRLGKEFKQFNPDRFAARLIVSNDDRAMAILSERQFKVDVINAYREQRDLAAEAVSPLPV